MTVDYFQEISTNLNFREVIDGYLFKLTWLIARNLFVSLRLNVGSTNSHKSNNLRQVTDVAIHFHVADASRSIIWQYVIFPKEPLRAWHFHEIPAVALRSE